MKAPRIKLGHDIEQEGISVIVEGLVIQKQLGQEAEILGIHLVLPAVDLEEGNGVLPVDFVAGRMAQIAFGQMPFQALATLPVLQAELADVDAGHLAELLRVGGEVPRLYPMPAQLDHLDVFHARNHIVLVGDHAAGLPWRWNLPILRPIPILVGRPADQAIASNVHGRGSGCLGRLRVGVLLLRLGSVMAVRRTTVHLSLPVDALLQGCRQVIPVDQFGATTRHRSGTRRRRRRRRSGCCC